MAVNVVSFSFSWCSTGGPGVHSAGCWLSFLLLISNFSGTQTPSGFTEGSPSRVWFPLPDLVYNSVFNCNWDSNSVCLLSWLSYITPTRSPTQSLKSYVWSSSSGDNCHAVHRSLSSGASVYESIMWFFSLSHFVSQFPPTRFPLLTAIGMCHFLPVHHLGMAFWAGSKVKILSHSLVSYPDHSAGGLLLLHRFCCYILQPQPPGLNIVGGDLSFTLSYVNFSRMWSRTIPIEHLEFLFAQSEHAHLQNGV